jgi:death-on-curing protein
MSIFYLDRELMEKMCHRLAREVFDTSEDPIAEFHEHELYLLDSALQSPRQTFDQKDLYPTLTEKATILYYSLNKNHPFKNGNKRISTASLLVFLAMNGHWLSVPKEELLNKTLFVAQSDPTFREEVIKDLNIWIAKHLVAG